MARCYLKRTAADVANEILMYHSAKPTYSHVVAEGADDSKLYGRFIDHGRCRIVFAGDKQTATDTLGRLNQYSARGRLRGYVVVIDTDLDEIAGTKVQDPNLIYTDGYNAECMLFREADLFSLLVEFGLSPQDAPANLIEKIEVEARKIGKLRLINRLNTLFLNFSDLDFDEFFDPDTVKIDERTLAQALLRVSHPTRVSEADIVRYCAKLPNRVARWQLVNGHDLMELLAAYLRFTANDNKITDLRVASILRVRYGFDQFRKTQTYRDIEKWEVSNTPFIVLRNLPSSRRPPRRNSHSPDRSAVGNS